MTLRVVCDTNVLVSAQIADGPPSRVLDECATGRLALVLPVVVREELERALRTKLGYDAPAWDRLATLLAEIAVDVVDAPGEVPPAVSGDPDDDLVLAGAVTGGADVLVTGDRRHLLPLGDHQGVRIRTAQALLAEMPGRPSHPA